MFLVCSHAPRSIATPFRSLVNPTSSMIRDLRIHQQALDTICPCNRRRRPLVRDILAAVTPGGGKWLLRRHRRRSAHRGWRGRPDLLDRAARQPAPAGRGGIRRPGLAGRLRATPLSTGGRQRARPLPRPAGLRHHLPGHRRRTATCTSPSSGGTATCSSSTSCTICPPCPSSTPAPARRRIPPGRALAAAAGDRPAAAADVRHAGARRRPGDPVAALPPRPAGRASPGSSSRRRAGRWSATAGRQALGRARDHPGPLRRAGRRGRMAGERLARRGDVASPATPDSWRAMPCSRRCAPAMPTPCCGGPSSTAAASCAPPARRSARPRRTPPGARQAAGGGARPGDRLGATRPDPARLAGRARAGRLRWHWRSPTSGMRMARSRSFGCGPSPRCWSPVGMAYEGMDAPEISHVAA